MLTSTSKDELRFTHTAMGCVGSFTLATCSWESTLCNRNGSMQHQPCWLRTARSASSARVPRSHVRLPRRPAD